MSSGAKKGGLGRAKLREEGLERTDNNLQSNTWPIIPPINQKNYYTEYLKRDEQIMVIRQQQEAIARAAEAQRKQPSTAAAGDEDAMDLDEEDGYTKEGGEEETEPVGSKVIVIHPGSQNLRIGLASDALPKTIPMVIARRSDKAEAEENEPSPKRIKDEDSGEEAFFGEEFEKHYTVMATDLRQKMRMLKRRILPNSRELVISFNRRTAPERINEHNDPNRTEWTEISPTDPPEFVYGQEALRIADNSTPRYKLYWPIRHGWFNEKDYTQKRRLKEDIYRIILHAIEKDLGIRRFNLKNYSCVLVVPDLYEKVYVQEMVDMMFSDFMFGNVAIFQESLSATFGAGFPSACIVDIGAEKTSICCVEEGMCIPESRLNIKYGGEDVTGVFLKMMLSNSFPYQEINLWHRYDYLLAEELKKKHCTLNDALVTVATHTFFVRPPGQETRKYTFKTYDEIMLAPLAFFNSDILEEDQPLKLEGRRSLFDRSTDIYDGLPNDPQSAAQNSIYPPVPPKDTGGVDPEKVAASLADVVDPENLPDAKPNGVSNGGTETPTVDQSTKPLAVPGAEDKDKTPQTSTAGSPVPDNLPTGLLSPKKPLGPSPLELAQHRDSLLPLLPLDQAINLSIEHAARSDEKRRRDFLTSIMLVGGGALVGGVGSFNYFLEERLRVLNDAPEGGVVVGVPPRELDPRDVVWKGASVFGRLRGGESWIGRGEYEMLGSRVLGIKCLWNY